MDSLLRLMSARAAAAIVVLGLCPPVAAQTRPAQSVPDRPLDAVPFRFVDVSRARGIQGDATPVPRMGAGAAAADYDDDGDVDLFVPRPEGVPDRLFQNERGRFQDVAGELGLATTRSNRVALWFDHDGDSDLDLLVGNDTDTLETSLRLQRQLDPRSFEDATREARLWVVTQTSSDTHRGGLCAGDLDNDGFLDLYVASWAGLQHLFHNDGRGAFDDASATSGLGGFEFGWQPMMFDANRDGWLDVYAAIDFTPNRLWINQRDLTFVDRARSAGVDILMNDMGMTILDYDNDGALDLYTSNIFDGLGYNALLRRRATARGLSYADVSLEVGVADGGWGWGITSLDADRDGVLEIAGTNGWFQPDASCLWRRAAGETVAFTEIGATVGFDDTFWGSCLLTFDADRDGDLDLFQTTMEGHLRLLENRLVAGASEPGHYLVVRPRMAAGNRRAIGAVVRVRVGELRMQRLISAGTSFLGQEPAEAFFGVGRASRVDRVRVEFPDGTQKVLEDVPVDQVIEVSAP